MAPAILLLLALSAAQPVEYEREGGSGTLTISPGANGVKKFGISAFGANAHSCELGGTIKGNVGRVYENEPGQPECLINFAQQGGAIEVTAQSMEACSSMCGARATFEGKYLLPPPACTPGANKAAKAGFLELYRAKQYQQAFDTLNNWFAQCANLQHWMEADRTRNDLAITLYHMKQPSACLATLSRTYAAEMKSMKAVEAELAPLDYEAYASTAKATFHNLKICSK
ncbi:hypothetical protein [Pseudoduganella sp. OTU4001]|uniref:hypothetical protein n=1 Tax=Pseudoduganella sp. OTU4001 TaxID=3043854 RepID=UPI00313EB104